ncbi:MAG TPA: Rieske 2Fe-2S domain-containing protein [Cyclobacteriaceae bacterium]|nr:Rieske 2Fe-2S domain-containing protein [Cyclobacteriaceae bacterium]
MDWIKIFPDSVSARNVMVTGRPQLVIIGSTRICLVLVDDRLLAIEDKCSHNGESLSKGTVNYLGEVICPWHGYRFNLKTGRESAERSRDLATYPVKEDDEGVFIGV